MVIGDEVEDGEEQKERKEERKEAQKADKLHIFFFDWIDISPQLRVRQKVRDSDKKNEFDRKWKEKKDKQD